MRVCIRIRSKLRRLIKKKKAEILDLSLLLSSEYIEDGKTILLMLTMSMKRTRTDVSLLN